MRQCGLCNRPAANIKGRPRCQECRKETSWRCEDCGAPVARRAKRCKQCSIAAKTHDGERINGRLVKDRVCPDCGKSHRTQAGNHRCPACSHLAAKHPCLDCGRPCDRRAERCNVCAPSHNQTLRERGDRTYHQPSGYWLVKVPADDPMASMRNAQGYVREHRLVVADREGRPLRPDEDVHHIDRDRGNNASDNLVLLSHADHMRLHAEERRRE